MVQDVSTACAIPEELYNLTQLAEVTLAAGRLSTNDINDISDYINNDKSKINSDSAAINNDINSFPENKQIKFRRRHTIQDGWPANEPPNVLQNSALPTVPEGHSVIKRNHNVTDSFYKSFERIQFFSSSDDDSNYYSHKIFDKKKSRRSTVSENHPKFDDLSCSSLPSSSSINGEEHGSGILSTKLSDENRTMLADDEHVCPECGKKYSTSSNLARHRQTHRSILDKKARRCPHCEKVYVSMPAFSMHVRTHNQGCKCPHCGKCFSRPWLLQGHIRTHTGEKPFKCEICSKAFADKSNLRAHIQTHSNTKPHSCNRCGKSFALKSYLYKHEESSCMRNHMKQDKDRGNKVKVDSPKSPNIVKYIRNESTVSCQEHVIQETNKQNYLQSPSAATTITWIGAPNISEIDSGTETTPSESCTKSYATLTPPGAPKELDRFTRISVIRTPISSPNYEINSTSNGPIQLNFYQENPVDFSPKNSFSHSMKTSPFQLTRNYAIVA